MPLWGKGTERGASRGGIVQGTHPSMARLQRCEEQNSSGAAGIRKWDVGAHYLNSCTVRV